MATEEETEKPETKRHATTFLVASNRALTNALDELGFDQADDRVIDYEGRLAFMTCSHDPDCDDLFALISELASRGESWELVTRIDGEGREVMFNSLARHRPVEAVETELAEDTVPPEDGKIPVHDLETKEGTAKLRADLGKLDPAALFVSVSSNADGVVMVRIVHRGSRRTITLATGRDEASIRSVIREILPTVMFDLAMKPPR
jgi:hypothetical protein